MLMEQILLLNHFQVLPRSLARFVEVNRPDYFHENERKSSDQAQLCLLAEIIVAQLKAFLS